MTPKHGDERNRRTETSGSEPVEFFDSRTGQTVYHGSAVSHTRTVVERWCVGCGHWVTCDGIMGFFRWLVEHKDHSGTMAQA